MCVESTACNASAARISLGSKPTGVACNAAGVCLDRACKFTPVEMHEGTNSSLSPPASLNFIVGIPMFIEAGFFRTQPASIKAASITLKNAFDSSSRNTLSLYSVPLKGFRTEMNSFLFSRDRGDLMRLTSISERTTRAVASAVFCVASARRCWASAKRDMASAAPFFADTISASKESASLTALRAEIVACVAEETAASALPTASPDASCASFAFAAAASAESFAVPALMMVSANTCSSCARIAVSALELRNSKMPSPMIPPITSRSPKKVTGIFQPPPAFPVFSASTIGLVHGALQVPQK